MVQILLNHFIFHSRKDIQGKKKNLPLTHYHCLLHQQMSHQMSEPQCLQQIMISVLIFVQHVCIFAFGPISMNSLFAVTLKTTNEKYNKVHGDSTLTDFYEYHSCKNLHLNFIRSCILEQSQIHVHVYFSFPEKLHVKIHKKTPVF